MSVTSPHNALPIDAMILEFRIVRVLGAGAFGIVYEARNTFLPQTVVIKEFLPSDLAYRDQKGQVRPLSKDTQELFEWARKRFLQEAKNLWELGQPERHPNIVCVTRYGEANGTAYMFMDFEQGRPLAGILDEQERLTSEQLAQLIGPLLDGLERVHAKGIVHRDIKPENILIRDDFSPVLIDFGAARNLAGQSERSVLAAYTPIFAALEQQQAVGEQGPWTDIYGLGATLYLAVTGRKPRSAPERLFGLTQESAVELAYGDYPRSFLAAIDKACELRPEDRPQSVAEWRALFEADAGATVLAWRPVRADDATRVARPGLTGVAASATKPPATVQPAAADTQAEAASEPAPEPVKRRWLGWVLALLLIAIVGLGVAGWVYRDALTDWLEAMGWWPIEPFPVVGPDGEPEAEPDSEPGSETLEDSEREPEQQPVATPEPERDLIVPGTRFSDPMSGGGSGPVMVWLPSGEFRLGSPDTETGRNADESPVRVRIRSPIAFGETEVTIAQFRRFVADTGYRTEVADSSTCLRPNDDWEQLVPDITLSWERPGYEVTEQSPVACVTWNDAMAYADWLSERTDRVYRLPTEAEWEYAARASTETSRFWGNDPDAGCQHANTAECDDKYRFAAPVGVFPPNPFGLRDTLGNLGEWTCSDYDAGYRGGERDCGGRPSATAPRVFRGGSWLDAPGLVRAAARDAAPGNLGLSNVGFRVARELDPESERTTNETASAEEATE
jgi:formylglycine-generating enzyme required for sulfatase activity